jgi:hypothetical protein
LGSFVGHRLPGGFHFGGHRLDLWPGGAVDAASFAVNAFLAWRGLHTS